MTALIVGTVFALGAVAYVLWPLFAGRAAGGPKRHFPPDSSGATASVEDTRDATADDLAEAEIRRARSRQRVCPVCGPRPEPGARYCSRCGAVLA